MGKAAKLEIAGTPVSLDLTHGIQGVCSTAGQLWLMVRGGEGTGKEGSESRVWIPISC